MKKILFITLAAFLFFINTTRLTFAHELLVDGPMGAVLHVEPEDDPIIGKPSFFFIDFKNKGNTFSLENCLCRMEVFEGDKLMYSGPLGIEKGRNTTGTAIYIFEKKGTYEVDVVGSAKDTTSFQPFRLKDIIPVTRKSIDSGQKNSAINFFSTHILHLSVGIVIIGFSLYFLLRKESHKKK